MSVDRYSSRTDAPWRPAGVGMAPTFRCGVCDLARSTTGRKLLPVRGMRQWVCRGCVETRAEKKAA